MAFQLPRLPFIGWTDEQFQIWWQQIAEAIEGQFGALEAAQAAQADATQALADAVAALSAANTAQTTATAVKRDDAISASWTSPGTILSAADVGASATITIAAHTRKYGDGTSVSISSDTITNRNYSTTYYIYYNDSSRSDTTPNFLSTTNPNTAAANAATGRHYCGEITTPASGGGSTSGGVAPSWGGGGIGSGDIP